MFRRLLRGDENFLNSFLYMLLSVFCGAIVYFAAIPAICRPWSHEANKNKYEKIRDSKERKLYGTLSSDISNIFFKF